MTMGQLFPVPLPLLEPKFYVDPTIPVFRNPRSAGECWTSRKNKSILLQRLNHTEQDGVHTSLND